MHLKKKVKIGSQMMSEIRTLFRWIIFPFCSARRYKILEYLGIFEVTIRLVHWPIILYVLVS